VVRCIAHMLVRRKTAGCRRVVALTSWQSSGITKYRRNKGRERDADVPMRAFIFVFVSSVILTLIRFILLAIKRTRIATRELQASDGSDQQGGICT